MIIQDFLTRKQQQKKISMITCYDYTSACIAQASQVDTVLVGDSLAMTMHGHPTTLSASSELMALHTQAVCRGIKNKFVVGDMPFLSYRKGLSENVTAAGEIMKAGAHAIKLEGAAGNLELIRHLVDSGIPVMGHLGLTPQSIHQLGGFKVQGKTLDQQALISKHSLQLQEAGCFAVVLECVPTDLAANITKALQIPTIGIGAGANCDGQVLVWQDMLGMNPNFQPKFLRKYLDGFTLIKEAIDHFHQDVSAQEFPTIKESYDL